jgi:hypothetical protein
MVPENRERFVKGELPRLDFQTVCDPYFHAAIERGLVIHRSYHHYNADRYLPALRRMYEQPDMAATSPEYHRFVHWYLRQALDYVREKGYAFAYLKYGDEWGAKEVDKSLAEIKPLREAGWKVVINPNGGQVLGAPELVDRLKPYVDIWQETAGPEHYVRTVAALQKERERLPPDGLWMVTTSSWWWNKSLWAGWQHGYTMAFSGIRSFHYHGWTRGGNHGAFLDNREGRFIVRPSVGYHMLGEGIQEAEYLTLAGRLVRYGRQTGRNMDVFEARLKSIVGPEATRVKLVRLPPEKKAENLIQYLPHPPEDLPIENYLQARTALLALIEEMQQAVGPVRRELRWGDQRLYTPDGPALAIAGGAGADPAVAALHSGLAQKAGEGAAITTQVNMADIPAHSGVTILAVCREDEALCRKVNARYPDLSPDPGYPHAGSYAVYGPLPHGAGRLVIILGGDKAGATLGGRNFVRFVEDAFGGETPLPVEEKALDLPAKEGNGRG